MKNSREKPVVFVIGKEGANLIFLETNLVLCPYKKKKKKKNPPFGDPSTEKKKNKRKNKSSPSNSSHGYSFSRSFRSALSSPLKTIFFQITITCQ
jgi:hypothetical protein